jgi:glycine/D-amino acid oxidase-like deaminating enzyme
MGLLAAMRSRARAAGTVYLADAVADLDLLAGRVASVGLASGERIACRWFVNAAGGQGAEIAAKAGIVLPVERRKRTVFAFLAAEPPGGPLPLTIEPSGVWWRPEGEGFIAGGTPQPFSAATTPWKLPGCPRRSHRHCDASMPGPARSKKAWLSMRMSRGAMN